MFILETFFFPPSFFFFLASPEDNGIVLEKEISKEEVVGIIELYRRSSAATETAQLQKIVLQMDKYGVRGNAYCKFSAAGEEGVPGLQMPFCSLKREAVCVSAVLRAELLEGRCSIGTKFCCSRKVAAEFPLHSELSWRRLGTIACKPCLELCWPSTDWKKAYLFFSEEATVF